MSTQEAEMGLTMEERRSVTRETAKRYQRASKKERGRMLDEYTALTGHNRTYGSHVLSKWGKRVYMRLKGAVVAVVLGRPRKRPERKRPRKYDEAFQRVLKGLWEVSDYLCGKRLAAFIRAALPSLESFGEIKPDEGTRRKLLEASPATMDRLLKAERRKLALKSRARTKPGTLLKHQIPVRTFSDWDDLRPGFTEADLVGHDGGDGRGEYAQTLHLTDVCTSWCEMQAVRNKARVWVFEALKDVKGRLPFPLLGLDSDNGGEFINEPLRMYCEEHKITFTRTRPYRKNDNCHVEQKNWSVIRRHVGYMRHDTEEELKTLNELYGHLRLYVNFFQPVMKLKEKTKAGSRVTKKYHAPKTPYQLVLESKLVDNAVKQKLRRQYERLNPAELKRAITRLQDKLLRLATSKAGAKREGRFGYNSREATEMHFV
jgi:hypothetical protein